MGHHDGGVAANKLQPGTLLNRMVSGRRAGVPHIAESFNSAWSEGVARLTWRNHHNAEPWTHNYGEVHAEELFCLCRLYQVP